MPCTVAWAACGLGRLCSLSLFGVCICNEKLIIWYGYIDISQLVGDSSCWIILFSVFLRFLFPSGMLYGLTSWACEMQADFVLQLLADEWGIYFLQRNSKLVIFCFLASSLFAVMFSCGLINHVYILAMFMRILQILEALLPKRMIVPSSFETVGHIIHLNLRDEHLPYKNLIAKVVGLSLNYQAIKEIKT